MLIFGGVVHAGERHHKAMKKGKLEWLMPQRSEAGRYCESAEELDPEPQKHQKLSPRKRARKGDTLNGEVHGISQRAMRRDGGNGHQL